jgi:hypothetical protein
LIVHNSRIPYRLIARPLAFEALDVQRIDDFLKVKNLGDLILDDGNSHNDFIMPVG